MYKINIGYDDLVRLMNLVKAEECLACARSDEKADDWRDLYERLDDAEAIDE